MANITQMAKTAGALKGGYPRGKSNRAFSDGSLQYQYFQNETQAYTQQMGQYASNVYLAQAQGMNPDDFYGWSTVKLRSIRAAQAQTGETMPDDWQRIYLIDPANYTYIPQGAMLKYADNTWIVYKGKNVSAIEGNAIVRRCNAVINVLDYYGNIVSVPMSYAKMGTLGNATHATENTITSKNYMACICQLNEYSWQFHENTRIILGNTAYAMRGLDNFTREFTDDPDSVHLLSFTIERVEVQPFDSVEYQVADYNGFSWRLAVDWNNSMTAGNTQELRVTSIRNGQTVTDTDDNHISYIFTSSDENVATVDEDGVVTGVSEGTVQITVALAQNPSITETVEIEIPAAESDYVAFTTTLPAYLHEGDSVLIGAEYFSDGVPTNWPVTFTISGPEALAYGVEYVTSDYIALSGSDTRSGEVYSGTLTAGSRIRLTAYHASPKPLVIDIESQGHTAAKTIRIIT